ncbi:uncharacterized protein LOC135375868 [Ornithodoros turicata]|uniref:uncharacterized protein LOC135375868 n=1 Tax=Ornithodoros turicata TaxID=34597 RepID=UPI003138ABDA
MDPTLEAQKDTTPISRKTVWKDSEVAALAGLELDLQGVQFPNKCLAEHFTTRTHAAIACARKHPRYKAKLKELREQAEKVLRAPEVSDPIAHAMQEVRADLPREEILDMLNNAGLDQQLLETYFSGPIGAEDVLDILKHHGREPRKKGKQGRKTQNDHADKGPQSRSQWRRARYRLHQKLYSLGPGVLRDSFLAEQTTEGPAVSLDELHEVYDPIFSAEPRPVDRDLFSEQRALVHFCQLTEVEVESAIRSMNAKSASGPDNVTLDDIKRVPAGVWAMVFNSWLRDHKVPPSSRTPEQSSSLKGPAVRKEETTGRLPWLP